MSSSIQTKTTVTSAASRSLGWSVTDILICTVLAVASGLVFWVYNGPGGALYETFKAVTPGFGGIVTGPWLFAGVLGGLVIRKPGAAIYCEMIAASVSTALGNQWGIETLYSGFAQGLGAEIVFALFVYRRFNLTVATLAGAGAGVGAWVLELFLYNMAKGAQYNAVYLITLVISGAVIAGVLVFFLVRGLAATGALDGVAAGREAKKLV